VGAVWTAKSLPSGLAANHDTGCANRSVRVTRPLLNASAARACERHAGAVATPIEHQRPPACRPDFRCVASADTSTPLLLSEQACSNRRREPRVPAGAGRQRAQAFVGLERQTGGSIAAAAGSGDLPPAVAARGGLPRPTLRAWQVNCRGLGSSARRRRTRCSSSSRNAGRSSVCRVPMRS